MKIPERKKNIVTDGLKIIPKSVRKKKRMPASRSFLNLRIDLDSHKFEGPLRQKIRTLIHEEIRRTFNIICSHCNRESDHENKSQSALSLADSPELSDRQKEIMELVVQGKSDRRISLLLGIKLNTVKNHMKNIRLKLGVHSRSEARDEYLRRKNGAPGAAIEKKPGLTRFLRIEESE